MQAPMISLLMKSFINYGAACNAVNMTSWFYIALVTLTPTGIAN
jgi:hypothetical protein